MVIWKTVGVGASLPVSSWVVCASSLSSPFYEVDWTSAFLLVLGLTSQLLSTSRRLGDLEEVYIVSSEHVVLELVCSYTTSFLCVVGLQGLRSKLVLQQLPLNLLSG